MKAKILFEDSQIIVVHKPAGLATQSARVGEKDLVSELKNYVKGDFIRVVHRLDQPVEGLLVFAKTKQAAADLSSQLGSGSLNKNYYVYVCGKLEANDDGFEANSGRLVDYMYKDAVKTMKAIIVDEAQAAKYDAKRAILNYNVVREISATELMERGISQIEELLSDNKIYLMDINIETGRFHQIRAQLSNLGLPILGDRKYSNELTDRVSAALGIKNVALFAYSLEFVHPKSKKLMKYTIAPEGMNY